MWESLGRKVGEYQGSTAVNSLRQTVTHLEVYDSGVLHL